MMFWSKALAALWPVLVYNLSGPQVPAPAQAVRYMSGNIYTCICRGKRPKILNKISYKKFANRTKEGARIPYK